MSRPNSYRWFFAWRGLRVALALALMTLACGCARQRDPNAPVEIRFWHAWGGYEGKFLQSLVDEFNSTHPRIRVKASFFNIGDKLLASIAGGSPPDVVTVWEFMLVTMGESGCFLPLEERLAAAGITRDAYLPNVWEYGSYGRHKWGVPTTLNALAIFYNTRVVREAGLDPARPPRSVAELDRWAARLTRRDEAGNIRQLGFAPASMPIWFWNFGGDVFDQAAGRFTLDRPENIRAMEWATAAYRDIGMDSYRRFSAGFGKLDSPQNPLFVGKIAMREDGQWVTQMIRKYAPDLDYGVFAYPPEREGQPPVTRIDGSFWAIPYGTRHPDEAWEFLRWLIAPPQSARFCNELRNIPPMRAAAEHPAFTPARQDPKFDFFVREVLEGRARVMPGLPIGQQFNEAFEQGQEMVWSGRIEPDAFLRSLNVKMNRELERAATLVGTGDAK